MNKPLIALGLVALFALTSPLASASATYDEGLNGRVIILAGPRVVPSNPVFQETDFYKVNMRPGDHISVQLTYTPDGTAGVKNDLDLTLLLPSGAPCSLPLPPTPDALLCTVNSRVARTTCTDTAASSHHHPALGDDPNEAIDYTVPSGGETGTYTLLVRGFLIVTSGQAYTVSIDATSAGSALPVVHDDVNTPETTFITTGVNCQLA